ncbi:MAG: ATP-grasp domain-containing protein [Treponema sp.]|nr:ATP-grasp domain-containing protein [Treponema sp.]
MKKNLIILGAGFLQKPAIEAAKKLGCCAVVVDANENAVCVPLADRFEKIDLKDSEAIFSLAKNLAHDGGLAAIFTAGTDFSTSVSYAGEQLSLHCHSYEAAQNASIKTRMRSCFQKHGLPSPQFFSVTQDDIENGSINEFVKAIGFPCVVKPQDNMGGRGCRMIRNAGEIAQAAKHAVTSSRTRTAILEQYMKGDEYSIDALIYDGTFTVTGFADRHIYFPPYFVEMGHTMPAEIDEKKRCELIATFALGAKALGLTCGAAKADIKYTENGPMIGEIAARLSGGYMSGWTYPYASGCNLTEQALLIACGKTPEALEAMRRSVQFTPPDSCSGSEAPYVLYDVPCTQTSSERAWISIPGVVKEVVGVAHAASRAQVNDVFPRAAQGECVVFPRNNVQKCGNVLSLAKTRAESVAAAERAVSDIVLRLEADNADTDAFLAGMEEKSETQFPPSAYSAPPDIESICGVIPQNARVSDNIPAQLATLHASQERDWNCRTFLQTCELFDELCKNHDEFDAKKLWKNCVRGGVQGMLYFADTLMRKRDNG